MASFDPNTPIDTLELDHGNTWHPPDWPPHQDKAKKVRLMINSLGAFLDSLAENDQMGGCHTVPQGMSTDLHHATGRAVVSNLNMGRISAHSAEGMICSSLDPAFQPSSAPYRPRKRTHTQTPAGHDTYTLGALQPSSALNLSCPSKQTHTQTPAGHDTYTPGASQPSSALDLSRPSKQTHTQTPAGQETLGALQPSSAPYPSCPSKRSIPKLLQGMIPIPLEPFNRHQHPAQTNEPVAHPPQQPDILPMRIPQQTSYEITEIKLRDVSIKLGCEWRRVGTYLGFSNSQIEVMQEEYRVVKECIFQMLLQWRNTNGVEATKEKFKNVLRRSQRGDLADFIDEADD